jgi:hypothetical protein
VLVKKGRAVVEDGADLERIRQVLELARRQIDQRDPKPDLALQYLKRAKDAVALHSDTVESAEYSLLVGAAFITAHNQLAESFLQEAEDKIARLPRPPAALEVRLYSRLSYFYEKVRRPRSPTSARKYLEKAKASAVTLGVGELTAHAQLRMIRLDLEIDNNPELENFKTLRRVGSRHSYPDEDQLATWYQHCGDTERDQTTTLYARAMQRRSEEYFLELLRSVRVHL